MADPIVPPLRKPVSTFPTPSHVVTFYTELLNRDDPAYKENAPVKRGSIYSTMVGAKPEVIDSYPLLYFLRERQFQQNDQLVWWDWATDEDAHDTYNSEDTYALESIHHPGFTRVYTIRRDVYEAEPAIALGLPLTGLIGVTIEDGGGNYTHATGTITGTDVAIDFVILDGAIISGIVTNEGTGVYGDSTIIVTGDGSDAVVRPIVQSTACVLVAQKKQELDDQDPLQHEFIKLIQVYASLPGPTIYTTRTDEDGAVVEIATTAKVATQIVPRETLLAGVWSKVNLQQTDNVYVGNEVTESRRVKTGNASLDGDNLHTMLSTRIDDDGIVVQIATTMAAVTAITEGETLVAGVWTKTTSKAVSDLVAQEIVETRVIPGNPMPTTRVDDDGIVVFVTTTLKDQTLVTSGETLIAGIWTKTRKEPATLTSTVNITDLVVKEVVESRAIPGNPMPSTKLDKDGVSLETVRTMKDTTLITTIEQVIGGVWIKKYKEAISDLVAWEVVEGRVVPGTIVPSANIGADHETNLIESTLKEATSIVPGASESGGTLTTVEQKEVSDLVSEEIVTDKTWLDEALYVVSIENLIPREFRAFIPTLVESHTVVGIASQPTLGVGEFESSEKQLTKIFKEVRTTTLGDVSLPITHTNQELTELYGGGVLNVTYTLELLGTGTIDEGLLVTTSTLLDLGNGMEIKETKELDDAAWPQLTGQDYDERLDVIIPYTQQVVTPGTGISVPKTDVKPIDQWREEDRTIDATAAAAVLDAYIMTYPSKINVDMPDRLVSVEAIIESSAGEGTDTQIGSIAITPGSTSYGVSQKLQSSANSSVALSPDVILEIQQFWGNNIDCTHIHFFLPNPVTSADVLTKINALLPDPVSDWPKYNPVITTLTAYGERRTLQVTASSGGSASAGGSSSSSTTEGGVGYSIQVGTTLKTVRISPTIHDTINLTGTTSYSRGISASAFAEAQGLGPAELSEQIDTAIAFVDPTSLSATEGATDWPSTGLYLYRVDAQPYRYGYVQFHAVIVDASDFPINP